MSSNTTLAWVKMTDVLCLLCYCCILGCLYVLNPPFPRWVVFPLCQGCS